MEEILTYLFDDSAVGASLDVGGHDRCGACGGPLEHSDRFCTACGIEVGHRTASQVSAASARLWKWFTRRGRVTQATITLEVLGVLALVVTLPFQMGIDGALQAICVGPVLAIILFPFFWVLIWMVKAFGLALAEQMDSSIQAPANSGECITEFEFTSKRITGTRLLLFGVGGLLLPKKETHVIKRRR
jgi:predicted nucleic acid-binding Zn ribbon protein